MPRHRPIRPQKMFGNFMVTIVMVVMVLAYYNYVFFLWLPDYPGKSFLISQRTHTPFSS